MRIKCAGACPILSIGIQRRSSADASVGALRIGLVEGGVDHLPADLPLAFRFNQEPMKGPL